MDTKKEIREIIEKADELFYRIRDLRDEKFHPGVTHEEIERETRTAQEGTNVITNALEALLPEDDDESSS